ncbi:MAG: hypothetical protein KF729_36765 [Sandaracinaceae bacterium]|nr:hypothetical protein [Sandaracinaceae bacterium]
MAEPTRQSSKDAPTVLLAVAGEPLAKSLASRVRMLGVHLEEVGADELVQTAFVTAPDLIVLGGEAAKDGGHAVLERLGEHHATSMLPVVVVGAGSSASNARAALRHGVVAIVDPASGAERMARAIKALASELPERTGEASGVLDEAELQGLVQMLTESRRYGLLSVTDAVGAPLLHMVVRGDRPVEETIGELAERLKALDTENLAKLRYEFQEAGRARVAAVGRVSITGAGQALDGRRVVLVERDAAVADRVAEALRAVGAVVRVAGEGEHGLEYAREIAPEVFVVDEAAVADWAAETLRRIRRDPLLCWGSLLVVPRAELLRGKVVDVGALARGVIDLMQPDLELTTRVKARPSVDARLEIIGPARTLRALAATQLSLCVSVLHPRVKIELDLVDGMLGRAVAEARGRRARPAEGPVALATLLHLPSARVSITRKEPGTSHVMVPVDEALAVAVELEPAIPKSRPPPPPPTPAPVARAPLPPPPAALPRRAPTPSEEAPEGSQVARLVDRLERLLRETTDDAPAAPAPEHAPFGEDDEDPTYTFSESLAEQLRRRVREERSRPSIPAAPRREPTMKLGSDRRPAPIAPPAESSASALLDELEESLALEQPTSEDAVVDVVVEDEPPLTGDYPFEEEPDLLLPAEPSDEQHLDATIPDEPTPEPETLERLRRTSPRQLLPLAREEESVTNALPAAKPRRRGLALAAVAVVVLCASGGAGAYVMHRDGALGVGGARGAGAIAGSERAAPDDEAGARGEAPREVEPPEDDAAEGVGGGDDVDASDPALAASDEPAADVPAAIEGPIEGTDEGFDLAAYGVSPPSRRDAASASRRARLLIVRAARARTQGELDASRRGYLEVLGLSARNLPATIGVSRVATQRGEHAEALAFAQRAARIAPTAPSFLLLADALAAAGDVVSARRAVERALAIDPRHRGARRRARDLASRAP